MQRYSRLYALICKIYCVVTTVMQILLSGTMVTATGMNNNISSYQSYTYMCSYVTIIHITQLSQYTYVAVSSMRSSEIVVA